MQIIKEIIRYSLSKFDLKYQMPTKFATNIFQLQNVK